MKNAERRLEFPEWLIIIGAGFFILVLAVSATWDASIRWLHFFQAWMYVATVWLGLRRNRWGYFIGISAAGLWDYINIFATTFFFNGLQQLSLWIQTGHLARPDLLIAVPAWFSNLFVVIGCAWAYLRRVPEKSSFDFARFVVTFALTTGFFALDMAIFQPKYLSLFWADDSSALAVSLIRSRPRRQNAPPDVLRVNEPDRFVSGWRRPSHTG